MDGDGAGGDRAVAFGRRAPAREGPLVRASERAGRSIIPVAFWWCSIGGGLLLLVYALYRRDPVFIAGQAFGVFVYLRNLYFVLREKKQGAAA